MRAGLLAPLVILLGCSEKRIENLEFDIVELKVNAFPERDLAVAIFRQDTAFASTYEDIQHLFKLGNPTGEKPASPSKHEDDDSLVAMKEVPVQTRTMARLNGMLNDLDFKAFAMNQSQDAMLDGTSWTLKVRNSFSESMGLGLRTCRNKGFRDGPWVTTRG